MKKLQVLFVLAAVLSFGSFASANHMAGHADHHKMMMEKMDAEMKSCMAMEGMTMDSCHDKMMMADSAVMMECKKEGMDDTACSAEMKKMMSGGKMHTMKKKM